ncbi:MAG: hypothetical protein M3277_10775 [Actinomycetota bacterium]|nr:hypothetical protein [Actinomycetota bacterium]
MRIFLASGDLQARARVGAAAERIGAEVVDGAAIGFSDRLDGIDLLVLDLDAGRDEVLTEIAPLAVDGRLPRRVIGFYSHVDAELAAAASAAGIDVVRRGRFWSELEKILGS